MDQQETVTPEIETANVALIRRLFSAAEDRGNGEDLATRWAAYEAMYHPEAVIHEAPSLPYGGDYAGPGAVANHARGFQQAWNGLQDHGTRAMEPVFAATGDQVVVLWRQQGRSPSGVSFDMPAVSVYRVVDGRVMDSRMFQFDSSAVGSFLSQARGTTVPS